MALGAKSIRAVGPGKGANVLQEDLIFVSLEAWDEIWRRNQFLCAKLLDRHPTMRILFVEPSRDFSYAVRSGRWDLLRSAGATPAGFAGRLRCYRPVKLLPNSWKWGNRCNALLARRQITGEVQEMGIDRPVLWINAQDAVHMVGRMGEASVIYDVTDDWGSFEQGNESAAIARRQDAELCAKADAVIVCSERLQEIKRPIAANIHLIPNGVDADHYQCVLNGNGPLPPEAKQWEKPVFGYTGTVHSERIDLDLVEELAKRSRRGSIVFVGPSHLTAEQTRRLRSHGNVHLTGAIPYSRIPEYMRAFDVCIVPHRITPFTESLNPIKLWEYLAAGKPIVSTNVAGFRSFPELIYLAGDVDQFARALEMALSENCELSVARQAEARKHSWSKRVIDVEKILANICQNKDTQRKATNTPTHEMQ